MSATVELLRPGDTVWVHGREAKFLYASGSGAVVRYRDERGTRVVSLRKLALRP